MSSLQAAAKLARYIQKLQQESDLAFFFVDCAVVPSCLRLDSACHGTCHYLPAALHELEAVMNHDRYPCRHADAK